MLDRARLHRSPAPPFQVKQSCGRGKTRARPQMWLMHLKSELCTVSSVYSKLGRQDISDFLLIKLQLTVIFYATELARNAVMCPLFLLSGLHKRLISCPENKQVSQCVTDASSHHCPKFVREMGSPGPSSFPSSPSFTWVQPSPGGQLRNCHWPPRSSGGIGLCLFWVFSVLSFTFKFPWSLDRHICLSLPHT